MTSIPEYRTTCGGAITLRDDDDGDGDGFRFGGTVVATDKWYEVGNFRERVNADAFDEHLRADPDVYLLVGHGGLPLARTAAKTMTVSREKDGIRVDARLNRDDPEAQAVKAKVGRGDVTGMSVGMRIKADSWERGKDGMEERTIHRAEIIEASITPFPANPYTAAEVRSLRAANDPPAAPKVSEELDDDLEPNLDRDDPRIAALEARVERLESAHWEKEIGQRRAMVDNIYAREAARIS